ncbi:MAG: DUF99 family protein [Candidatus Thorarchaeota archaeon]
MEELTIVDSPLKEGVKILGIVCTSFDRSVDRDVEIIGAIVRGASILEGVIKTRIAVDGDDATSKIIKLVKHSSHQYQLKMILTKGITIAGFNFIDIEKLYKETNLPVIAIIDRKPDLEEIKLAIKHVSNWETRYELIEKSNIREVIIKIDEAPIYIQSIGYEEKELDKFLKKITIIGRIPEPIRIARLIASAEFSEY